MSGKKKKYSLRLIKMKFKTFGREKTFFSSFPSLLRFLTSSPYFSTTNVYFYYCCHYYNNNGIKKKVFPLNKIRNYYYHYYCFHNNIALNNWKGWIFLFYIYWLHNNLLPLPSPFCLFHSLNLIRKYICVCIYIIYNSKFQLKTFNNKINH